MNKIWIMTFILLSVDLMISNTAEADATLIKAEIHEETTPKRRLNVPGFQRSYSWDFEDKRYTVLMVIDEQWYNRIRNQKEKRHETIHLPPMVYEGTKALQELVREFKRVTQDWKPEKKVNFVLAFVQTIPYEKDKTTGYDEFYKYPTETLAEGKGDCEDSSMLFASILSGLDYESALIDLPGHIAVGVKGNFQGGSVTYEKDKYFFCETTVGGYKLGVIPQELVGKEAQVIPITPKPIPPKPARLRTVPSPLKIPSLPSPQRAFQNGIDLYQKARYNEAIKSLQFALTGLRTSEQLAKVYIYLGAAEYGFAESSISEAIDRAKVRFQEALRQNPDQGLPWSHPKFTPWFEEVRRNSIGELTVFTSPLGTEIWIYGDEMKRKKLGSGTTPINIRLFKGTYTVEGIHEGRFKKENVKIEPNSQKQLELKIQPLPELLSPFELLSPPEVADINQKIMVRAKVIDDIGAKSIYLFYRFSHSLISKPSEYNSIVLTKDTSDIYSGYIPSHSEAGYVWYYLTTDRAGNNPKPEIYKIRIKRDGLPEKPPILNEPIAHQGIWANYAWSSSVFEDGASLFDWNRGDSINFTYLHEGKNHQTFGVQLDYSYQNLSNMSAIFQWAPALKGSPITLTLLGGVAGYSNFDSTRTQTTLSSRPLYMTPILGLGLKLYPLDRISIDAMCSFKLPSDFDITFLYHYEIGTRIYINNLLNMKFGYSQFELGEGNLKRMQIGLGFTF